MNLWVTHTREMANMKRRREAAVKALVKARVVFTQKLIDDAGAGGDEFAIPFDRQVVRAMSVQGLEKIVKHLGIK